MRREGFVMILALIFMLVLAAMVMALAYYVSSETRGIGFQLDDTKALYLAQAGAERAFREIRNEVLAPAQTGTADLRGADTTGSIHVGNVDRISYIDEGAGLDGSATINVDGDIAQLRRFDSNYTQTRIVAAPLCVLLFARASRATGGQGAILQVSYSTNGSFPQPGNTVLTQALPNTTTLYDYFADITADRTWTWSAIMDTTFTLRAQRTDGNRKINLDAIWLRVAYAIDTNTEAWFTGSYDTFPKALGDGFIQSVSIADEASKVHLNYASQSLLSNLLTNLGITNAGAKATAIVNYRGAPLTNPFDTVEELQQVTGIASADYAVIKNYVTVYSYINQNSYDSHTVLSIPVDRAPVNINTASFEVLKAIFDPLGLGAGDSTSLANDIITFRTSTPFTCFYSFVAVPTDFIDFVNSRSYLTIAERTTVIDNADSSLLAPISDFTNTTQTTEFCYANTTYKIESVGKIAAQGPVTNDINLRVKMIVGNDGNRTFQNYTGDTTSTGYWKENYE